MAHLNSAPPEQSIRRPRRRLAARAEPAQPSGGPSGLHSAAHHSSAAFSFYLKQREQTTYPLALEPKNRKFADGSCCALIQTTQRTGTVADFLVAAGSLIDRNKYKPAKPAVAAVL